MQVHFIQLTREQMQTVLGSISNSQNSIHDGAALPREIREIREMLTSAIAARRNGNSCRKPNKTTIVDAERELLKKCVYAA